MQMDIGAYIAELLFEHQVVNVPALGGFVTQYQPAVVDQVLGKITPPGKKLNFNKNLVVDDGLLINFVKEKHGLTYSEAQQAVKEYVEGVLAAINRREIVVFPKVGRLYRDHENKLQFLPDNTNFDTEVYGLPTVEFHPVSRSGVYAKAEAAVAPARKLALPAAGPISEWFQRNIALISILSVLVVATGFYFIFFNNPRKPQTAEDQLPVPSSRINISPSQRGGEEITAEPGTSEEGRVEEAPPADVQTERAEPLPPEESTPTDAPTLSPDQQYCVIQIGIFGDPDNVERLVQRIFEAGFEPYTEPAGRLTLVGVQFAYETERDIQTTLGEVRNKFESRAKVIRK